jgi:hypothetical protein
VEPVNPESSPAPAADAGESAGESAGERKCGRCQLMFPPDPDLNGPAQQGWWVCPPCREALTGHQSRGRF